MNKDKLNTYKKSLNVRYTGLTESLIDTIENVKVDNSINMDLNNDGKFDKKDAKLAAQVLAKSKTKLKGE